MLEMLEKPFGIVVSFQVIPFDLKDVFMIMRQFSGVSWRATPKSTQRNKNFFGGTSCRGGSLPNDLCERDASSIALVTSLRNSNRKKTGRPISPNLIRVKLSNSAL